MSASRTSTGLVNPITGKRFVKHPQFDMHLAFAKTLYRSLEAVFAHRIFFEKSLMRIFVSPEERNHWRKKRNLADFSPYILDDFAAKNKHSGLRTPLGGYCQRYCGNLDTSLLLDNLRTFYRSTNRLEGSPFYHEDIDIRNAGFCWKETIANHIIFCEGYRAIHNPYFSWLPFQPSKGEVLTLNFDHQLPDRFIKGEKWLVPLNQSSCKVGATYQWQPIDETSSQSARKELLQSVRRIVCRPLDIDVTEHKAGVRPNTLDKCPFLGEHPSVPAISIFNGFGSKGALTIPWYASRFTDYLLEAAPLPPEANISRYHETHFPG